MKTALNFVGMIVNDLQASEEFFVNTLGYEKNEAASIPGNYVELETGSGVPIGIFCDPDAPAGAQVDPCFFVDDVDAVYAEWQAKGGRKNIASEVTEQPFGRYFFFRSPEGHIIRAMTPPQRVGMRRWRYSI